jgi:hypothetical protein
MRARDFLTEFQAPTPYVNMTTIRDDILLLLNLNPSPKTLNKVEQLLSQADIGKPNPSEPVPPDSSDEISEPKDKKSNKPVAPVAPVPTDNTSELDEAAPKNSLLQRVDMLIQDKTNPNRNKILAMIEAALEQEKLEELTIKLVDSKFKAHSKKIATDILGFIMAAHVPIASKLAFFPKATAGLIDYPVFFAINRVGNFYDSAVSQDPLLSVIGKKIAQLEYGTGANRFGKMEILMILVGKGVTKEGSGDLHLSDGKDLEIKASGPTETLDKKTGKPKKGTTGAALYALAKDKKTGEQSYGANTEALRIWRKDVSRILGIDPKEVWTSLSSASIRQMNEMTVGQSKRRYALLNAIKNVFKHVFKYADDLSLDVLNGCINRNGIDADMLVKAARQIEFDYYKKNVGHDAVLFINYSSGNYYYIDSGEELMQYISSGQKGSTFYTTGIIDLKGTYANGLSKIFTV